jgi:hypothetical protein
MVVGRPLAALMIASVAISGCQSAHANTLANTAGVGRVAAPAGTALGPWSGRSGEAEALADLANGSTLKLYTHLLAGERAQLRTPGLRNCDPDRSARGAGWLFAPIPDADMSESIRYTDEQLSRMRAASAFAKSYNLTIFNHRRATIAQLCPGVEKIPD